MNEILTIKEYFPRSYTKFTNLYKLHTIDSLITVKYDTELKDYIKSNTRNLNIFVDYIRSDEINAFTIPDSISYTYDLTLTNFPIIRELDFIINIYSKLLKANLDAFVDDKNIIVFTHNLPSDFKLKIFQTSALKRILQDNVKSRFAICLHEIGHWHNIDSYLINNIIYLISYIKLITTIYFNLVYNNSNLADVSLKLLLITLVVSFFVLNYISSINEQNCDNFVIKLGYGKELTYALNKMNYSYITNTSSNKLSNLLNSFNINFKEFIYMILNGYPSDGSRTKAGLTNINENILNLISIINLKTILTKIDKFFGE